MNPTRAVKDHRVPGPAPEGAPTRGLDHVALPYRDDDEYADGVAAFVAPAIAAGEPALLAVPGRGRGILREALGGAEGVAFADMEELGANPARIIPAIRAFLGAHAGRPVRFVGEPIWPGREDAALREATRHEALLNVAFARDPSPSSAPTTPRGCPNGCSTTPGAPIPSRSRAADGSRAPPSSAAARFRPRATRRCPSRPATPGAAHQGP